MLIEEILFYFVTHFSCDVLENQTTFTNPSFHITIIMATRNHGHQYVGSSLTANVIITFVH